VKIKMEGSWTEAMDGFPTEWGGRSSGLDVFASEHQRVSALLGPDGEPLMVGYSRPKLGFDLSRGRRLK